MYFIQLLMSNEGLEVTRNTPAVIDGASWLAGWLAGWLAAGAINGLVAWRQQVVKLVVLVPYNLVK